MSNYLIKINMKGFVYSLFISTLTSCFAIDVIQYMTEEESFFFFWFFKKSRNLHFKIDYIQNS